MFQLIDEDLRSVPMKVTEKSPGVYHVEYTITTSGKHTVMVRIRAAVGHSLSRAGQCRLIYLAWSCEIR